MTHVFTVVSTKLTTTHNDQHTEKCIKMSKTQRTGHYIITVVSTIAILNTIYCMETPIHFLFVNTGEILCAKNVMKKNKKLSQSPIIEVGIW